MRLQRGDLRATFIHGRRTFCRFTATYRRLPRGTAPGWRTTLPRSTHAAHWRRYLQHAMPRLAHTRHGKLSTTCQPFYTLSTHSVLLLTFHRHAFCCILSRCYCVVVSSYYLLYQKTLPTSRINADAALHLHRISLRFHYHLPAFRRAIYSRCGFTL